MRRRSVIGVFIALVSLPALPAAASAAVGFHGDGSGVVAEADPPISWSDDEHLLWRTPLPNWGTGQPVVCAGRAYVLSEPLATAPILTCIDVADGAVCFQVEIDHLDAETRRDAATLFTDIQRANALQARHFAALVSKDETALAQVQEEIAAAACHTKKTKGRHVVVRPGDRKKYGRRLRALRQRGAGIAFWCIGGDGDVHHPGYSAWEGLTYAAPVADESGVWVWMTPGVAASYSRSGEQRWLVHLDPFAKDAKKSGRWPDCKYTSSPVLVDGTLVVVGDDRIHGLDADTGEERWVADMVHGQGWEPCPLLTIELPGADPAVIAHDGVVYRARDGRPLVTDLPDCSDAGLIVHGDIVVMQAGHKRDRRVAAWRLRPAAGTNWLVEELWSTDAYRLATDHDNRVPICYDGTIYGAVGLVDLATGELRVESKRKEFFHSHASAWMAGGRLYCHGPESKTGRGGPVPPAVTRVCDAQTMEVLAVNHLSPAPIEGAKLEQLMAHSSRGALGWGPQGLQTPFIDGDRIYIRSHDHLFCIGTK